MTDLNDIQRDIKDVAEALSQAKERGDSASILLGAGASVSAGIPLANGFVEAVQTRFPRAYGRAAEKTYPQVMREVNDGERHDLIASYVERARLNWAHILLGWLVHHGYVGRILTTNFDNLALRCTGLYGVYPAVYDVTALARFDSSLIRDPAVLFLHGQHRGFVQLHTRNEVTENAQILQPIFAEATVRRPWIVLGYSGDNDPVFECLTRVPRFRYGLYWIGYREAAPSAAVARDLLGRERQAYLVSGHDADSFMIGLLRELGLGLPPLFEDPFQHGLDVLEQFAAFPTGVGSEDFTAPARTRLKAAQRWFIDGVVSLAPDDSLAEQTALVLQGYLFRGDHEKIIAVADAGEVAPTMRRLVAVALGLRAEKAGEQVTLASNKHRDLQVPLAAALADYDRAIGFASDLAELYVGRASVRITAAEVNADADEFLALVTLARQDLEKALRLQPDLFVAVHNEAYCDAIVAQRQSGPARRVGLEKAIAGFDRAIALNAESVMTYVMAARAHLMLWRDGEVAELSLAQGLHARAQQIQPRHYELQLAVLALDLELLADHWRLLETVLPKMVERAQAVYAQAPEDARGQLLLGLIQTLAAVDSKAPASRAAFDAGWQNYVAARDSPHWRRPGVELDLDELRGIMAAALWMEANNRGEDAGAELYRRADAEFAAAARMPGQASVTHRIRGTMLTDRAEDVEGPLRMQLLADADNAFKQALAAAPDDPDTLIEWSSAKMARIDGCQDAADAAAWYGEAIALLRRAASIRPGTDIEFKWARACKLYAVALGDSAGAVTVLRDAAQRYERALVSGSEDGEQWTDWADCAQALAQRLIGDPTQVDEVRLYLRKAVNAVVRVGELGGGMATLGLQIDLVMAQADFEEMQGRRAVAKVLYQQAEDLLQAAMRRDPKDRELMLTALDLYDSTQRGDEFASLVHRMATLDSPLTRAELAAEDFELLEDPSPAVLAALAVLKP